MLVIRGTSTSNVMQVYVTGFTIVTCSSNYNVKTFIILCIINILCYTNLFWFHKVDKNPYSRSLFLIYINFILYSISQCNEISYVLRSDEPRLQLDVVLSPSWDGFGPTTSPFVNRHAHQCGIAIAIFCVPVCKLISLKYDLYIEIRNVLTPYKMDS